MLTVYTTYHGKAAMNAIVHTRYGSPDVLELTEMEKPELTDDGVLVRVRAAAINPADWYGMAGRPYAVGRPMMGFLKPRDPRIGADFAGKVEAVGREVAELQPGDEVYGLRSGALAEYVCATKAVARKPANLSFEEAAAVPVAGFTALQALRDHGRVEPGQRVLVNGASGGVGTFAVQIAKAFGADVTAVCSTDKVELVRSLGAEHVVDYTREDFTRSDRRYDVLLDVAGSRSWREYKRVLTPEAKLVLIGAPKTSRMLGPLKHIAKVRLAAIGSSRTVGFFIAKPNKPDLDVLRELIESGKVKPVVDRRFELGEIADAFRYLGEGHARGKIVVTV